MAKGKTPKTKQQVRKDVKTLREHLQALHELSDPQKPGDPKKLNARIKVIKDLLDKNDTFMCADPQLFQLKPEDLGPAGKRPGKTKR
ncbi:MAG TPA: hypothetical protein VKY31_11945 [Terriglobia bacterium]|jgi:hypothetical protein|nr:hypothetical protein [Terriglobia bacterium]